MKEPHGEGVANHADLESCAGGGDIAGEALTGALAGRLWSREMTNQHFCFENTPRVRCSGQAVLGCNSTR